MEDHEELRDICGSSETGSSAHHHGLKTVVTLLLTIVDGGVSKTVVKPVYSYLIGQSLVRFPWFLQELICVA
jgi:hypothetical protein